MSLSAINDSRRQTLASRVRVAETLFARLRGLLGTRGLPVGDGLWIRPCQSVHTFFMRYSIDVVYLDAEGIVIYAKTLLPWRLTAWVRGAKGVLELPAGTVEKTGTRVGDRVTLKGR